jgi:hypothetical protein
LKKCIYEDLKIVCDDISEYMEAKQEALEIIEEIRTKLINEMYKIDEDNPKVDI